MGVRLVDLDSLIYLKFDHSPGYAQWHVMLNLGQAQHSTQGDGSSLVIERFGKRGEAEKYIHDIYYDCVKPAKENSHGD